MKSRVLIIEDDPALLRGLKDNFSSKGYLVETAADGERGLQLALEGAPDLIVLDIMLPKVNGYEICRAVREQGSEVPILMLTAKGQEEDVILGLNLGADDYVVKPFRIRELLARANALVRRTQPKQDEVFRFDEFEMDLGAHKLFRGGREVPLTAKEFRLLAHFVMRQGRALTRDEILNAVWGSSIIVTGRSVDRCVTTLRAKIEPDPHNPIYIQTVRDIGYRFERELPSEDPNPPNVDGLRMARERLAEAEQAERAMAAELEQAAEIQRQLLPAEAPAVAGLDLAGYNAACRTVGGDYYDFLAYPDGRIGIVIADVAGKGMPAALVMASLQAKVQALADTPGDTAEMLGRLNRGIAGACPPNRFVTLFFAVLDPRSGELAYSNAGHNPPFMVRPNGEIALLEGGGPPLGILAAARYQEERARMAPGDVLLLYSDGVTEAFNPAGEEFDERVKEVVVEKRGEPAAAIVKAVHEAVATWTAGQLATDDITVVVARRTA